MIWKWLRSLTGPRIDRSAWYALLAELDRNTAREDVLYQILGTPLGVGDVNDQVAAILTVRERRVEILHGLGWHDQADKLAADTAMRRSWAPIDMTPLRAPSTYWTDQS